MTDYDYWFFKGHDDDCDDENCKVLEMCVVKAEEMMLEAMPEDLDFQVFKETFVKLYEKFIDVFTSEHYWDLYEKWLAHEMAI